MEKENQSKINWLEKKHEAASDIVGRLESDRRLDRSTRAQQLLRNAKKEKLRLKDEIACLKNQENL